MEKLRIAAVPFLLLLFLSAHPAGTAAADRGAGHLPLPPAAAAGREIVPAEGFRALFANDQLAGLDAFVIYLMQNDELLQTKFFFPQKHVKNELFFEDFAQVEAELRRTLGEPTASGEIWRSGVRKETADPGRMVAVGELTLKSQWETEDTIIVHSLRGEKLDIDHEVNYVSKRLSRAAAEAMNSIRPKHFF